MQTKESLQYQGIILVAEANVALTLSAKSVGRLESMYNSVKPINIFMNNTEIAKSGRYVLEYF